MDQEETQLQIATRLQTKWLLRMEKLLDDNSITSTDMATLFRFLHANGWSVDPARMPKRLQDMVSKLDPKELEDDDILPMRRKA